MVNASGRSSQTAYRYGGDLMRLTRRGRIVRAVAIAAGLALLWWISGHVWITEGGGCIGSMSECGI
jgi:hypothetical protein